MHQFLAAHEGKIFGTNYPDEVFKLNQANYFFHLQQYDKAWQLLEWNFEDIYLKLAAKRIEVKLLDEQQDVDLLDSRLNALKVFVHRASPDVISDLIKEMNNAFVRFMQQLLNPSTTHDKKRVEKIRQRIVEESTVAEREWLFEKLTELTK